MRTRDKKQSSALRSRKSSLKKKQEIDKEEFPGYPHYAAEDDITKREKRVDVSLDDETFNDVNTKNRSTSKNDLVEGVEDEIKTNSEFDVTKEDLEALGPKDLSLDMGDDEALKHRSTPVDFSAKDLDIPGSELDDDQEEIGSEDEENNHYSQ